MHQQTSTIEDTFELQPNPATYSTLTDTNTRSEDIEMIILNTDATLEEDNNEMPALSQKERISGLFDLILSKSNSFVLSIAWNAFITMSLSCSSFFMLIALNTFEGHSDISNIIACYNLFQLYSVMCSTVAFLPCLAFIGLYILKIRSNGVYLKELFKVGILALIFASMFIINFGVSRMYLQIIMYLLAYLQNVIAKTIAMAILLFNVHVGVGFTLLFIVSSWNREAQEENSLRTKMKNISLFSMHVIALIAILYCMGSTIYILRLRKYKSDIDLEKLVPMTNKLLIWY
ncbi:hypothetical protein NEFER03_1252 [Nematocida sp. LUAm3]|nr:hypothetical protein NEFER03_1252 [Nematocida sp. LUAm3]KAI5174126.1 hypothetical protein NEFER02_0593 [Nematocida sp. LUAm2]KAI5177131.1 hypothetical protein NEFER01_0406 [Nematocida sp. LUAm1]